MTHNVSLISKVCNEIWECGTDKSVEPFQGDFEDYAARLVKELKEAEVRRWRRLGRDTCREQGSLTLDHLLRSSHSDLVNLFLRHTIQHLSKSGHFNAHVPESACS